MKTGNPLQTLCLFFVFSAIALSSCKTTREIDPNATAIAVMGILVEGAEETAQAIESTRAATIAFYETESAQLTGTAGVPPGSTANPLTPVATDTTNAVIMLVNADCRYGPGTNYGVVLSLFSGETALVLGVDPGGTWLYIQTLSGVSCWILGSLVSAPTGGDIPVLTPPPTPFFTLTPTQFPSPTAQDIGTPVP
ncbi:MAG TPA: hypothetical protein VMN57_00900 [Anaerolineales bacterium]|nr:hypothetical protein [Anaerolineales bacterium]